ncbi:MAG TPA: two-component regulator propeller domain-containing protein [Draconibacterium sp.]|nr:two-component regulator propeller domain-containing protein [Draconibacterium sp.]
MIKFSIKLSTFFLLATLLFSACDNGDEPQPEDEFQLPSKIINKIEIDADGVKWFATEKGIVSFDGTNWTIFSDNDQLTNGAIFDITAKTNNNSADVWIGGKTGVSFFTKTENPVSITNYKKANSEILSDTIYAVGLNNNNTKFIGTAKGLSILENGNWTGFYGRESEPILKFFKITDIAATSGGSVYVSTQGGGVSRFVYTDAVSGATTLNLPWASGLVSENVFTVVVVNEIEQWYGTDAGAAHHTSESTKADWQSYSREDGLVCDTVYAIAQDKNGNMWFGTHKGISKFSGSTWINYNTKDGLVADKVNTVAVDTDGSLWFGTDKGISHFTNGIWETIE